MGVKTKPEKLWGDLFFPKSKKKNKKNRAPQRQSGLLPNMLEAKASAPASQRRGNHRLLTFILKDEAPLESGW